MSSDSRKPKSLGSENPKTAQAAPTQEHRLPARCTICKTGPGGKTGALGEGGRFWVIGTILLALVPGDDIYTSSFALYVNFG